MKRNLLVVFIFFVWNQMLGQSSESWINYSQTYYKIPVAKEGIYRLSYSTLQLAGLPVDAIDPTRLQLFHRGVEQAIFVEGESDLQFNNGDFLEFYGTINDGKLDVPLYESPAGQPNPYRNLFSDTTCYFLTVGVPGKRMPLIQEENTTGLPAATYTLDEKLLSLSNSYSIGESLNDEISTSRFGSGEGWVGTMIGQGNQIDYTISDIEVPDNTETPPTLEIMLVGRNSVPHKTEIYVGSGFRLLTSATFNRFETQKITQTLQWSDVTGDGKLPVRMKVVNSGYPDRASVAYIRLVYPQKPNALLKQNKSFIIPENAAGKTYVEIANTSAGFRLFDITNSNAVARVGTTATTTLNAVIPFSEQRKIFGTSSAITPTVVPVTFREFIPGAADFVIISHPLVRKPSSGYSDPVKAYGAYRASDEGGGYDTLIANMPMLFDQFNYGEKSPVAVFNFLKYLSGGGLPKYLFIIGKGLDVWYSPYRNAASGDFQDLVPASGFPASDMLFSTGLGSNPNVPAIPTGRLTAMNPGQVEAYLNKVKEHEQLPFDALWRKNLLHLSGGIEDGEPEAFQQYLEDFAGVADGPYFGAKVDAIAKKSRDVQVINIAREVNEGVNLVTFFGHSSPETLDFDIGYVSDAKMGYDNKGKYPMLLMNGCEAGAFFLKGYLFGEDWVMTPNKGATGFIAHSSYGLTTMLYQYSLTLYKVGYGDESFIEKGIGDIQVETARRFITENTPENEPPDLNVMSQSQQMVLLGDPSIRLFGAAKPDLEIHADNITVMSTDDSPVSALSDSIAIEFVVQNFGKVPESSFRVEITRTLNDNSTRTYDSVFQIPAYADTLVMVIPQRSDEGGVNAFTVTLDADGIIDEILETNNTATINYAVPSNGTKNLFPRDFAIVSSKDVSLSFQSTDLFSGERDFILEIDTSYHFDSEFKRDFTLTADVLGRQSITLLDDDSMVYYWRTRLADPLPGESDSWQTTSFTVITGSPEGWAQIEFAQLLEDPTVGLVKDEAVKRIRFEETVTAVDVLTFGAAAGKPRDSVSVKIDGQEYNLYSQVGGAFGCRLNTVNLMAFDKNSTVPYVGVYFKWYEILYNYGGRRLVCGREPFVINSFTPSEVATGNNDDLLKYVDNIAEGDSVLLFNIGDAGVNSWPAAARAKVAEFGISEAQLSSLVPGAPFVILGRKGSAPGSAKITTTSEVPASSARLTMNGTITGGYSSGTLSTRLIGPATDWDQLHLRVSELEEDDKVSFTLEGIKLNGESETLLGEFSDDQDLSFINASEYPYLRITLTSADPVLLTSAQLRRWIVLYTPAPEGLLLPVTISRQETVNEGDVLTKDFRFVNISDKSFPDSLAVEVERFNQSKRESGVTVFRIKEPDPGDTTTFSVKLNSVGAEGLNDITVRVNPKIFPEQYYDNNVFQGPDFLDVVGDNIPPVMEVLVDGRYVRNGDFVSSNPIISIKIIDENRLVVKSDTAGMQILLTYPCDLPECEPTYIPLSSDEVQWFPESATSDFRIEFRPQNLPDGLYQLEVTGADSRGNSVEEPYRVDFVVASTSKTSILSPYPNPSNGDVSFGFVVKGDDVPSTCTFRIFSVTGKAMYERQIADDKFYTGTNSFIWHCDNAAGIPIPNGIYLYNIDLKVGGKVVSRQGKIIIQR